MERKNSYLDYDWNRDHGAGGYNLYNQSANAYNYAQGMPAQSPFETPETEKKVTVRKTVRRKLKFSYRHLKDKSVRIHKMFFVYALVFFLFPMGLLARSAANENTKIEVEHLRKEFRELKEANDAKEAQIMAYDENEIRDLAGKLGMSEPKQYQKIKIDIPRESYVKETFAKTENKGADKSFFKNLLEGIGM